MTPAERALFTEYLAPKRNKYRAKRTKVDGITFASKAEAGRYAELKRAELAGAIQNLRLQVRFPLAVNGKLVCTYVADFVYHENGKQVVEDKKGVATKDYIIKRKLFAAIYGAKIVET